MLSARARRGGYYLAALDDQDRLVGYAGFQPWWAGPVLWGARPCIRSPSIRTTRARGSAPRCCALLLARADELQAPVVFEVRTDNDTAIALYERHGSEQVGLRRRHHQPSGADAYTMVRPARRTQEVAG